MNKALLYRPAKRWPLIGAFAAATTLHLSAIALAAHREKPPVIAETDFPPIGFVDSTLDPPPPAPIDVPMPSPPPNPKVDFADNQPPRESSKPRSFVPLRSIGQRPLTAVPNPKVFALNAPRPEYPYEARSRRITGSGICALTIDTASGIVISATMEQSIGSEILDQASISAFKRWRFKRGTPVKVRIPITFTMTGASY